ncbi:hemin uptake protein HemP [Frateuria sp.]|uniref:hemin uptake protein HemP n=1 Tax=Frateuria sp. TaxID=2211372 RepID=UPI0025B7CE4A|nr:hemin uptake protein HemP [Frateuria sp.]
MSTSLPRPSSPPTTTDLPHACPATVRRVPSGQLLPNGARELVIQHQGGEYHLRLTRNDKLILTK